LIAASREQDRGARGRRQVIFDKHSVECPIYLRSGFTAGDYLRGPSIVEELGATILVYPGDHMQVDQAGHLVIDTATS
jgi:N-methylhydantoinase A